MSARKLQDSLTNLRRATARLEEAVNLPRNTELVAEGTIQRFEFVFELLWKTVKRALEYEGRISKTPRDSLKEAYSLGWLDDETIWRICWTAGTQLRTYTFIPSWSRKPISKLLAIIRISLEPSNSWKEGMKNCPHTEFPERVSRPPIKLNQRMIF